MDASISGKVDGLVSIYAQGLQLPCTVQVQGRVTPLLEFTPSRVYLPRTSKSGDVWEAQCLLNSRHSTPVELTVTSFPKDVRVTIETNSETTSRKLIIVRAAPAVFDRADGAMPLMVCFEARVGEMNVPLELPILPRTGTKR